MYTSSKWAILLESNTKNGELAGLRNTRHERKKLCTTFQVPKSNFFAFTRIAGPLHKLFN